MNDYPLISVIIPSYNAEKWIYDCCMSVFSQTYPNIELIIVDDGSTDDTFSLVSDIAQERDNVRILHIENSGVCCARNKGIEISKGDYISFLDSDDTLFNNALEVLYYNLTFANADISVGWKTNMTAEGKELGCPYERIKGVFSGTEALKLSLEDHPSMYAVWGKLYKRNAIGDVRFIEGRKVHEDSFFLFECLLKQPKVVLCDELVLRYRISENSASRCGFSDKFLDILFFADQKKNLIENNYPELHSLSENVIIKANMALLKNLIKTKEPEYKKVEKKAINDILIRKSYYKKISKIDDRLFWIITHRLYSLYKALYMIKTRV